MLALLLVFLQKLLSTGPNMPSLIRILRVLALGSLGAGIFNFIGMTVVARLLDPSVFGTFSVYASLVSILAVISTFRLDVLIFQKSFVHASHIFVLSLFVLTFFSIVVLVSFLSFDLGRIFFDPSSSKTIAVLIAFGVFCLGGYQTVSAFALKQKIYNKIALARSVQAFVGSIVQVALAIFLKFSFLPLVAGFLISQAFGARYLLGRFKYSFSRRSFMSFISILKKNYRFCSYSSFSTFLLILSPMLPSIIISKYLGFVEAGFFYLAVQLTSIPFTFFRRLFSSVALAEGKAFDSEAYLNFIINYKKHIYFFIFAFVGFSIIYFFLAEWGFVLVLGEGWEKAGKISAILAPMFFIDAVSYSCFQLLNVNNRYLGLFFLELLRFSFVVGGVLLVSIYTRDIICVAIWYSLSMAFFYLSIVAMLHFYFSGFKGSSNND